MTGQKHEAKRFFFHGTTQPFYNAAIARDGVYRNPKGGPVRLADTSELDTPLDWAKLCALCYESSPILLVVDMEKVPGSIRGGDRPNWREVDCLPRDAYRILILSGNKEQDLSTIQAMTGLSIA